MGERLHKYIKVYKNRWIGSMDLALKSVISGWNIILENLEHMIKEPQFQKETDSIKRIIDVMRNKERSLLIF